MGNASPHGGTSPRRRWSEAITAPASSALFVGVSVTFVEHADDRAIQLQLAARKGGGGDGPATDVDLDMLAPRSCTVAYAVNSTLRYLQHLRHIDRALLSGVEDALPVLFHCREQALAPDSGVQLTTLLPHGGCVALELKVKGGVLAKLADWHALVPFAGCRAGEGRSARANTLATSPPLDPPPLSPMPAPHSPRHPKRQLPPPPPLTLRTSSSGNTLGNLFDSGALTPTQLERLMREDLMRSDVINGVAAPHFTQLPVGTGVEERDDGGGKQQQQQQRRRQQQQQPEVGEEEEVEAVNIDVALGLAVDTCSRPGHDQEVPEPGASELDDVAHSLAVMAARSPETAAATARWKRALQTWDEQETKTRVRALVTAGGVPTALRGRVWLAMTGNPLKITDELFAIISARAGEFSSRQRPLWRKEKCVSTATADAADPWSAAAEGGMATLGKEQSMHLLEQDLPRTFPEIHALHDGTKARVIRQVLETFVVFRPDVGYVQGMSYLASVVVLHLDDPCLAFTCFANVLSSHFGFNLYRLNREEIDQHVSAFDLFFESTLPDLCDHFARNLVGTDLFYLEWCMTLFCKLLPLHIVCRVMDSYVLLGEVICVRVSLAFLHLHAEELLRLDMAGIIPFLHRKATALNEAQLFCALELIKISPAKFEATLTRIIESGEGSAESASAAMIGRLLNLDLEM